MGKAAGTPGTRGAVRVTHTSTPSAKTQACTGAEAPWVLARRDGDFRPQKPGLQGPQQHQSPPHTPNLDPDGTRVKVHPAGGGPVWQVQLDQDATIIQGQAGSTMWQLRPGELCPTWPTWVSQAAYLGRWPARRTHKGSSSWGQGLSLRAGALAREGRSLQPAAALLSGSGPLAACQLHGHELRAQ